jgi:hypothetical protein
MSYVNGSAYYPSSLVRQIHGIPHLNSELQLQSSTFDAPSYFRWNSYTESLVVLPVILASVFATVTLFMFMTIILKPWNFCSQMMTTLNNLKEDSKHKSLERIPSTLSSLNPQPARKAWAPSIRSMTFMMVICLLICILWNNSAIYANHYLSQGIGEVIDNLQSIITTTNSLYDDGISLASDSAILSSLILSSTATCPDASTLIPYANSLNSYLLDYNAIISPIPGILSEVSDDFTRLISEDKDITLWSIYSVFYLLAIWMCLPVIRQRKRWLQLAILIDGLVGIIFICVGSALMAITVSQSYQYLMYALSNQLDARVDGSRGFLRFTLQ